MKTLLTTLALVASVGTASAGTDNIPTKLGGLELGQSCRGNIEDKRIKKGIYVSGECTEFTKEIAEITLQFTDLEWHTVKSHFEGILGKPQKGLDVYKYYRAEWEDNPIRSGFANLFFQINNEQSEFGYRYIVDDKRVKTTIRLLSHEVYGDDWDIEKAKDKATLDSLTN